MATKNANVVRFISIQQTGYDAAKAGDSLVDVASLALDNIPEFAAAETRKDVSKETRDEFNVGARKRYSERYPAVEYAIVNNNFIRRDALDSDAKVNETVKIGVEYAFSMSQQEVGGLKENDPQRHAIVTEIRNRCNAYCSNAFGALFAKVKQLQRERNGEAKTRQQALQYAAWLEKILDDMKTRVISAESRGDTTADKKRLNEAVIAFKTKYFN
jgi:hypothetical protein